MMRIPPYYKQASWQRFFAGVVIGMLIGWFFFIYLFGNAYDRLIIDYKKQEATIKEQEEKIQFLRSDQEEKNKENERKLTIQEIKVFFNNEKDLKLNELTLHELRSSIESELTAIRKQNIATVASSRHLLIQTLENKIFTVNDKKYQIIVKELYLFTTLELYVDIQII